MAGKKEVKVGDIVEFKYDIEQSGPVVAIKHDGYGAVYTVKATEGGYVEDYAMVDFSRDEIYTDED